MIKVSVSPPELVQGRATDLDVVFTNTAPGVCSNVVFKLSLPPEIRLLRGNELIQLPRIGAGETISHRLQVRADAVGRWRLGTANFSYRDPHDIPVRVPVVAIEVNIGPAAQGGGSPETGLLVEFDRKELRYNEWTAFRCHVENVGKARLRNVGVVVYGSLDVREKGIPQRVGTLGPGEHKILVLHLRARRAVSQVSVDLMISHTCDKGLQLRHRRTITLSVREPLSRQRGSDPSRTPPARILYLAANPSDTRSLRLGQEFRDISNVLKLSEFGDRFELVPSFAVRVRDISQDIIRHSPQIIHFAGHGAVDGSLYAEDEAGNSFLVDKDTVVGLVRLAEMVKCVLINACDTYKLAEALAEYVDYVVGMRYKVDDKAAIEFSVGFYQAIGANWPIETAFDAGRALLRAHCQNMREIQSPFLLMGSQSLFSATE